MLLHVYPCFKPGFFEQWEEYVLQVRGAGRPFSVRGAAVHFDADWFFKYVRDGGDGLEQQPDGSRGADVDV